VFSRILPVYPITRTGSKEPVRVMPVGAVTDRAYSGTTGPKAGAYNGFN